jgi:hypothetical protein
MDNCADSIEDSSSVSAALRCLFQALLRGVGVEAEAAVEEMIGVAIEEGVIEVVTNNEVESVVAGIH